MLTIENYKSIIGKKIPYKSMDIRVSNVTELNYPFLEYSIVLEDGGKAFALVTISRERIAGNLSIYQYPMTLKFTANTSVEMAISTDELKSVSIVLYLINILLEQIRYE